MASTLASTAAAGPASPRVGKPSMIRLLHRDPEFAELFTAYLLSRNARIEEDLVDQLFNSSEKRLARSSCCSHTSERSRDRRPSSPR